MLNIPNAEMEILLPAISPERVSYLPQAGAKRVARSLCRCDISTMTAAQRDMAIRIACRYRRDMPRAVQTILAWLPDDAFTDKT